MQTSRSSNDTPTAVRSVSLDQSLASVVGGTLKRAEGSSNPSGGSQIVINIPATTLPRLGASSSAAEKRDEFRSCDSIWSVEKAASKSVRDQGNCHCNTVRNN